MSREIEPPVAGQLAGNIGEPILLEKVEISGFAVTAAKAGEKVKIQYALAMTTQDPGFHALAKGLMSVINYSLQQSGKAAHLDKANTILLVIRPDKTAELWLDTAAVTLSIMAKRPIAAGSAVFAKDIADISAMSFPLVEISAEDQVACLFREGWHFGLVFNFNPDKNLDVGEFNRALGTLVRKLRYWELYETISDQSAFQSLIGAGWFPFVEIIGEEFQSLVKSSQSGFALDDAERKILDAFGADRCDHLLKRWLAKPHLAQRKNILESAIKSFLDDNPVATIKTVLTELEGILADSYEARYGRKAKLKVLLKFATDEARAKTGSLDSLLLPESFGEYLAQYTFANFDPRGPKGAAGSRHAVGHGAADPDSYTMARALQALLTLDQLAFYT
nr:hypothetical protein [uncultured Hyphomonas sp.]